MKSLALFLYSFLYCGDFLSQSWISELMYTVVVGWSVAQLKKKLILLLWLDTIPLFHWIVKALAHSICSLTHVHHTHTHIHTHSYYSLHLTFTCTYSHTNSLYCEPLSHYRRNRAITPGESPYTMVADSISIEDTGCTMDILNTKNNVLLTAEVSTLEDSMFRLKIKEKAPLRPRYEVEGALVGEPKRERWRKVLCWFTFCEHTLHLWRLWCTTHGQNYVLGMY